MKFTINGFQQVKLLEVGLDVKDAFILRFIKDMCSNAKMEHVIHKNNQYTWINYTYIIEQLPIIGKKNNLMKKVKKYEQLGLLERITKNKKGSTKGTFAYIKTTVKLADLEDFVPTITQSNENVNTENVENIEEKEEKTTSKKELFNYWVEKSKENDAIIKHRKCTPDMQKAIKKALKIADLETLKKMLDRFIVIYNKNKNTQYKLKERTLQEFYGQKAWQKDHLICEEYGDEGIKWVQYNKGNNKDQKEYNPFAGAIKYMEAL